MYMNTLKWWGIMNVIQMYRDKENSPTGEPFRRRQRRSCPFAFAKLKSVAVDSGEAYSVHLYLIPKICNYVEFYSSLQIYTFWCKKYTTSKWK